MRSKLDKNSPDDLQIEQLLNGFKPQPSTRYHDRMSTAPWHIHDQSIWLTETKKRSSRWKPVMALAAFMIVLVVLSLSFIPSVRVAADKFIHFFLPAASEQLNVHIIPGNPFDSMDFLNPSNFSLNIDDLRQQAGFFVKVIPTSSATPTLIGARYEHSYNAALLLYKGENYTLLVTQRPLGSSQDVLSIGADAQVEFVKVDDVQGEYVVGGWNAISTLTPSDIPSPSGTVQINAVWDEKLPQFTLRWQESGFAYELRCNGENCPSQSQLITWANELK